jgi:branched-chain amino acid transport system permease protein
MAHALVQAAASGLLWGLVYALVAVGLTLIFGVAEIVNFAHGAFLMVAMYLAWVLNRAAGLDPLAAVPVCALALFLLGAATHRLLMRRLVGASFFPQIIATFGLLVFLRSLAQVVFGADYHTLRSGWLQGSVGVFGVYLPWGNVVAGGVALGLTAGLYLLVMGTDAGLALRAVAENRQAAALLGVDVERTLTLAWGLGSACAGAAGAVLASFYYVFPTVGDPLGLIAFIVVALGGFGSIPGALLAALAIGLVEVLGGFLVAPAYKYAIVFLFYLAVLTLRPQGLLGRGG